MKVTAKMGKPIHHEDQAKSYELKKQRYYRLWALNMAKGKHKQANLCRLLYCWCEYRLARLNLGKCNRLKEGKGEAMTRVNLARMEWHDAYVAYRGIPTVFAA